MTHHCFFGAAEEKLTLLIDQGTGDEFLTDQLKPGALEQACIANHYPLKLRMHEGYDHSYYFIATFIEDHLRHHAQALLPGRLEYTHRGSPHNN